MQLAQRDPRIQQAVDQIQSQIGDMPVTSEGLAELIKMLEAAVQRPDIYPKIREAAIKDGMVDEEDLPERFEPVLVVSVLVALYMLQERVKKQGFARGGLAQVAALGRGGDTMLAHINPREAAMLRAAGGSGTINPATGLPEYGFLSKLFKVVAPIALSLLAPGIGTAISGALGLGLGTVGTAVLGGAVTGALGAGISGGNVLQGALLGGLGQGLGGVVGGAANKALGMGLGQVGQSVLGGGLVGGLAGAATGQGFGKGALQGAVGQYLGGQLAGAAGNVGGALGTGLQTAATQAGNILTAGYDPKVALAGGALSGLAHGIYSAYKAPSELVSQGMKASPRTEYGSISSEPYSGVTSTGAGAQYGLTGNVAPGQTTVDYGLTAGGAEGGPGLKIQPPAAPGVTPPPAPGMFGTGISPMQMIGGAMMLSSLANAPQSVQSEITKMSPEQQEYFNRSNVNWDWSKMQQDAARVGQPLSQFMAENWPTLMSGAYVVKKEEPPEKKARGGAMRYAGGGALSNVARMARGAGTGRSDDIDARLSDGEYVMDAETVALLGDGSTDAGARKLDEMRAQLRRHKGKTLAKGKFSPNAKSPLSYMKEVA